MKALKPTTKSPAERRKKYGKTRDHAAMIDDPDAWFQAGMLPLKSFAGQARGQFPKLGILLDRRVYDVPGKDYIVFETCMTELDLEGCRRHAYPSAKAVVAAGWEVD